MLLSINNVSNWDHHLKMKLTDVGSAIRKGTPFLVPQATMEDLIGDSTVRKYNFQPDNPTALTESSLNNFLKATSKFPHLKSVISIDVKKKPRSATWSFRPYLKKPI